MKRFLYHEVALISVAAILALTLGGFWYLAVLEEKAILADSNQRLDDERLTIRRMEIQLNKTTNVVETYRQNLSEIEYFRANFLTRKDERLVQISRFLEETARAQGLQLEQVSYNASPSRERDMDIHTISLPLEGRYRDIRAFVDKVETSDLFLVITEMSLEDEAGRSGVVTVQMTLATYFERSRS